MAVEYAVLGQLNPQLVGSPTPAATLQDLYTVPSATQVVVSTLVICNQSVTTKYRIAIRPAGAAIDPKHYIAYDAWINANDTMTLTLGISLGATDVVSVYAETGNVAFNLFGAKFT